MQKLMNINSDILDSALGHLVISSTLLIVANLVSIKLGSLTFFIPNRVGKGKKYSK